MEDVAGWIALAATCVAALMTASNLGARVTGWGFVVFTVGSIAWSTLGMITGQQQLLLSNIFLTAVNLLGIWRWLGRQARFADGGRRAMKRSERTAGPTLLSAGALLNAGVTDLDGDRIATVVDAMLSRDDGSIVYLVASRGGMGGLGETLYPIDPEAVDLTAAEVVARLSAEDFDRLPALQPDRWPSALPPEARLSALRGGGARGPRLVRSA